MLPLEASGKKVEKLSYKGDDNFKITDAQVQELAKALLLNDKFCGPLKLDKNGLSDLAILAVSEVLRKPGFQNITLLSL